MARRRVTISCPGCRNECEDVRIDKAEDILFNGCEDCQELGDDEATVERDPEDESTNGHHG